MKYSMASALTVLSTLYLAGCVDPIDYCEERAELTCDYEDRLADLENALDSISLDSLESSLRSCEERLAALESADLDFASRIAEIESSYLTDEDLDPDELFELAQTVATLESSVETLESRHVFFEFTTDTVSFDHVVTVPGKGVHELTLWFDAGHAHCGGPGGSYSSPRSVYLVTRAGGYPETVSATAVHEVYSVSWNNACASTLDVTGLGHGKININIDNAVSTPVYGYFRKLY